MITHFQKYLQEISQVKNELEHSGRTFLQNLLTKFADPNKIKIKHEPRRDEKGRGAPDFKFVLNDTEIGYLENKQIGTDLDQTLQSEQLKKYQTLTDNLILTDYLRWIWIYQGNIIKDESLGEKTILDQRIQLHEATCQKVTKVTELIESFLAQKPQEIVKAKDLAEKLSKPTRTIKAEINDILKDPQSSQNSRIVGTFKVFKTEISENITAADFADAFAQTLTYSLFLTKITSLSPKKLTLSNIANLIPTSFALIKDILVFITEIEKYPQLKPYLECLFHLINHTKTKEVLEDLQNKKEEYEDPYIHFYENFLTAYDQEKRKELGVWYTPKPIVRSIVNNIQQILKKDFNLPEGLADPTVKVLDFACGTGTFLFEIYEQILATISQNSLKKKDLIKNHILKNIFGFELLIPAYCVSHLKLSQRLKTEKYLLEKGDRIKVYFTNTLENRKEEYQSFYENFFPEIAQEGKTAQQIKDDETILVITGNPPYNGSSKNNFPYIKDLIKPYFPQDEIKEKLTRWLQDDYVKFIRFAENKIAKAGKGMVAIITNHSFIDNPTFRAMRKHLMETFDKIVTIDLHGNTKKKEKCPDGTPDQNVFAIQQGVAISFFIKNKNIEDKGVYHLDIWGKRKPKLEQTSTVDLQKTKFAKIKPSAPFYLFLPQNEKLRKEYEKGWSLKDIWQEINTGICSQRDQIVFQDTKDKLLEVLEVFNSSTEETIRNKYRLDKDGRDWKISYAKENIKNFGIKDKYIKECNYRPFDKKWTYYTNKSKGFIAYPRYDVLKNMTKENVGLVFVRQSQALGNEDANNLCFISDKLTDINMYRRGGASIAPLYLYKEKETMGVVEQTKVPNFKPEFSRLVREKFDNPTPEEVLGFIYASLHSPTYRSKYLEFLKNDFPRINFEVSKEKFSKFSRLGQELIAAHLLEKIPPSKIGEPLSDSEGEENFIMEKVHYHPAKQRLYFNKTCYFANVSAKIWEFKIGGYHVLDKYLKSRKGRDISGDVAHVQEVIKVLGFTIEKMEEIKG